MRYRSCVRILTASLLVDGKWTSRLVSDRESLCSSLIERFDVTGTHPRASTFRVVRDDSQQSRADQPTARPSRMVARNANALPWLRQATDDGGYGCDERESCFRMVALENIWGEKVCCLL